jgi:hypothetical protein
VPAASNSFAYQIHPAAIHPWTRHPPYDTHWEVKAQETRVRPLLVRPGARFACVGDGLCCTDVHALGPVRRREVGTLRLIAPEVVRYDAVVATHVLTPGSDGRCLFLGEGGCALHAALGSTGKPSSCRRFPFGLVATPAGGRITTEHRCPCRTMGPRPPLSTDDAYAALEDGAGRLRADHRAPRRVRLDARRSLPFEGWVERERPLLERLAAGDDAAGVIEALPFPDLVDGSWPQVASEMVDTYLEGMAERGRVTRFETALGWFGEAVMALHGVPADPCRQPSVHAPEWADVFDRAEARSTTPAPPGAALADWVADEIWALWWAVSSHFRTLRADVGTRLAVASQLMRMLQRPGVRPDRVEAEALTIIDLVGTSDWWRALVRRMRVR